MDYGETIGRLIGVAHHLFQRRLDDRFRTSGVPITAEQFKMMSRLWQKDGISQQELSNQIGRNRAATGRMVDTLEKNGFVERKQHESDRRLNLVFLTEKGGSIKQLADKTAQEVLNMGSKNLSPAEQDKLKKTLKRIIENLG